MFLHVHLAYNVILKALFSSLTRVKLLQLFLLAPPESSFFVRELTRLLDEQINSIRRELENLESIGMLRSYTKDRKKYYQIDETFSILPELRSMFRKHESAYTRILERIQSFGDAKLVLLSGRFVGEETHVDLLIVGDIDKPALASYLSGELSEEFDHEIRYSVLTEDDFRYRVQSRDTFALKLLTSERTIYLENNLHGLLDDSGINK